MITVKEGSLEIKGTNLDVCVDSYIIIDELITNFPEIPVAIFAAKSKELNKAVDKCDPKILSTLIEAMSSVERSK